MRWTFVATGCLLALGLAGCAGKSAPAVTMSASAGAPAAPSASLTASPSPTASAVDQTIRITYAGGKVVGGAQLVKVKQGGTVAIVVTSDVADEVHFHGYDLEADVAKGGTVTITFTAKAAGRYIVELEKLGRRLATLQIQ
jgi:FtsP/CotA-like multicopper oxidase with cupredoxin domain